MGSADVGKSTLLGVLTQGQLDNGRGRARLNMFRHLHEIQTGRTSSISHEILGFDSEGNSVDYSTCNTAEEICENATKLEKSLQPFSVSSKTLLLPYPLHHKALHPNLRVSILENKACEERVLEP